MRSAAFVRRAIVQQAHLRSSAVASRPLLMRRVVGALRHTTLLLPSRAALSTVAAPSQHVKIERSTELKEVQFKTTGAIKVEVNIRPSLGEHVEVNVHGPGGDDAFRVQQTSNALVQIIEDDLKMPVSVDLHVPVMLGLQLSLVQGSVHFHDKIEGDVRVTTGAGDIHVNKVRGMKLQFTTNNGAIRVSNLLEGENIVLSAKQVDCKKMMAKFADVKLTRTPEALDSAFGALYVAQAVVSSVSTGSLRVGNIHGALDIKSQDASLIHVGSVNGSLHVEDVGDNCDIDVHFDSLHQLADGEHASDLSCGGQITISVEPSLEARLEMHAEAVATDGCSFEDLELDQLDEDYVIASGVLIPQAAAASSSSSSGKINLAGAKDSAMTTSFFSSSPSDDDAPEESKLPTIFAHACSGKIAVSQLNWMDKIRRKHAPKSM
ncbi:hypothetical protein ACHHYP_03683 [Achlya hypogyna]|uniref:Adhesin domain-containing protein n=1 Tax=Achlya hypogyna TaxID=1202772 RepID=A0A1V9Z3D2_ACHHY|nr:hypothetical protein ACHHYP_03683 [Achlya hypogyna]